MEKDKSEISKEKILKVATKLFGQKSFDGVSIREICKEANVNISMISYYFGGKQELYNAILADLVKRQTEFAESIGNIYGDPFELPREVQIEILYKLLDRSIDFFYSNITGDMILFLVKAQQSPDFKMTTPAFEFLKKLLASILHIKENSKELVFKMLTIISFINSPKIMQGLSLRQLGQEDFTQEDIKIIRSNLKNYLKMLIEESDND